MTLSASDTPTLTGGVVQLRPLDARDSAALLGAAADGKLWDMRVTVIPGPDAASMAAYIARALEGRKNDTVMPFVVVCRDTERVVGSTRFWKIDRANRKLEIGHTWLSQSVQGSAVNTEAKYLLLRHAFEVMDCVRVQFTADELNARSRAAILRLGATQEGIIRHERIMPDGRKRNSIRFSIIDAEWLEVKRALEDKLQERRRLP
ncbi:MAG: GNAT family N-acetyltransferase [Janthinobacterium lividum]